MWKFLVDVFYNVMWFVGMLAGMASIILLGYATAMLLEWI